MQMPGIVKTGFEENRRERWTPNIRRGFQFFLVAPGPSLVSVS